MKTLAQAFLAPYTSFNCGGPAELLTICENYEETIAALHRRSIQPVWLLGYGCNVLVADGGLAGITLVLRGGDIAQTEHVLVADGGVWWDDVVQAAIQANLWGIECMSAIPGGVAAAVVGNIAAYGQAVSDTLQWVEVFDPHAQAIRRLLPAELHFGYRFSALQNDDMRHLVVLRAAFTLATKSTTELTYQSALSIAEQEGFNISTLSGRRQIILQARQQAGSLWDYRDTSGNNKTAGSFFRNPVVTAEQAERIIAFDETGKSAELIKKMNSVHGGDSLRVSAAHVLLAAGFQRGQHWGDVRLHPQHVLKIENAGQASAQDIYNVAHEIITTVQQKLDITLVPEVRFLGEFS